jgi:hypothetical protein
VPAAEADLDDLLDGLRATPRLCAGEDGNRIRSAVRDAAARMAWLGVQLPELTEAEINPLVLLATGPGAVDVRIRTAPAAVSDPWLRSSRSASVFSAAVPIRWRRCIGGLGGKPRRRGSPAIGSACRTSD